MTNLQHTFLRKSKVSEHSMPLIVNDHIVWFQVAIDDVSVV